MGGGTKQNRAIIERTFDAYNRRDLTELLDLWHPELTIVPVPELGLAGTSFHGHIGFRSRLHDTFARFSFVHSELHDRREVQGRVLATGTLAWGKDRGSARQSQLSALYTMREGRLARFESFASEAAAVEAAERPPEFQFEILFQRSPIPIVLNDDAGRFIDANPAASELLGLSVSELRKRTIFDLVQPELIGILRAFWRDLRDRGELAGEFAVASASGEQVVEIRSRANFAPGRHVSNLVTRREPRKIFKPMLTPREREVLRLLALGYTSPQAADALAVSPETVRSHVQNVLARFEAKTRAQAIVIALQRGEIEL